jgi:hypothetical protein
MNVETEHEWTLSQRGAPALQIGTDLYRIQKKADGAIPVGLKCETR